MNLDKNKFQQVARPYIMSANTSKIYSGTIRPKFVNQNGNFKKTHTRIQDS